MASRTNSKQTPRHKSRYPAFRDGKPVAPAGADQVRPAGAESVRDAPPDWDHVDQAVDESFPASDPPADNRFD